MSTPATKPREAKNSTEPAPEIERPNLSLARGFWATLRRKYSKLSEGEEDWGHEERPLRDLMPELQASLPPRYTIDSPIGVGGTGVVLKLHDSNLTVAAALKFPRPKKEKEEFFQSILESEINSLLESRHPNIVSILYHGTVNKSGTPFYVMEFIPDASDALEFLSAKARPPREVIRILRQALAGLGHLHALDAVHLDIKLENLLVGSDGRVVISDLGSARKLSGSPSGVSVIHTADWAHPDLLRRPKATTTKDRNRRRVEMKRKDLRVAYDLYALGQNIRRLIHLHRAESWPLLDAYTRKYLDLLAARLLDGRNGDDECALGLPPGAFKEIKYETVSEVEEDLAKLSGDYPLDALVPELDEHNINTIQVSALGTTVFTERLSDTIAHPAFQRLAGISQLGFISLVYPTASHSRLEHVLGTFGNCARIMKSLYLDRVNPLFRQIMRAEDFNAGLFAALSHDLGHYPLAHDVEEALPDRKFSHEKITLELLTGKVTKARRGTSRRGQPPIPRLTGAIKQWGVTPQRIADILSAKPEKKEGSIRDRILHSLIDGPIDADKLDYLVRDSVNLNVPFGRAIDHRRLVGNLTIVFKEEARKLFVAMGIHEGGRVPAESVAFARYAMFGAVYWHHASRAAKAMLHRAIWEGLVTRRLTETRLSRDLREFVAGAGEQLELLSEADEGTVSFDQVSRLLPGDREFVAWLSRRTSETGKRLLEALNRRALYKRLISISEPKNHELWNDLIKLGSKPWSEKIAFQRRFTEEVVEMIEHPSATASSATTEEELQQLLALNDSGTALLLVDIPQDRPGGPGKLWYLPEADRTEVLESWKSPVDLEVSILWREVHDEFLPAAGKIRVFCPRDALKTLRAVATRAELEQALRAAL